MNNKLVTGHLLNDRIYFDPFNNVNENSFVHEYDKKYITETGIAIYGKITGFFCWMFGLAYKLQYNENKNGINTVNFVFVSKKSMKFWLLKFRMIPGEGGFDKKRSFIHQERIKHICDVAIDKIRKDEVEKKELDTKKRELFAAIDRAKDRIYNDAVAKAKEHFGEDKNSKDIIKHIKEYLADCDYKTQKFFDKEVKLTVDKGWHDKLKPWSRQKAEAVEFIKKFLDVGVSYLK